MDDLKSRIDEVASIIDEFRLSEAELSGDGWRVLFRATLPAAQPAPVGESECPESDGAYDDQPPITEPQEQAGTPISSPMAGIFYSASSPSNPPFVHEGAQVAQGQVVGLIEAMKVFNEIVAPLSGSVLKIVADNGALVQPGEPIMYIG